METYLQFLCGNRSLNWAFWDVSYTWKTKNPDFTECFQHTLLEWVPIVCLACYLPFKIHYIAKSLNSLRTTGRGPSDCQIAKRAFLALLAVSSILEIVNSSSDSLISNVFEKHHILLLFNAVTLTTLWVVFIYFSTVRTFRQIFSSDALFIFWLLELAVSSIQLRTAIQSKDAYDILRKLRLASVSARVVGTFGLFMGCCKGEKFEDNEINRICTSANGCVKTTLVCPEEKTSFLARISFLWFTR
ncbi:hypothetical protein EG68_12445 [Paragonimus skrjabini miyazakii]|uniref:ABC transporter TMD0 domain-containing protein n=1 Tax=Paragonimus skrjabini miyazakii TaxID=59628 RepID=A0A8S9YEN6_9TREM|nr:hypothetical protein EG68_12445 [Paragonimus skrjabini miyazakii]